VCGCDRQDSSDSPELAGGSTANPMQVRERDVRGEHGVLRKRDWASGAYPSPSTLPSKFADRNSTYATVYFNYRIP
jgi:hypothetical protein